MIYKDITETIGNTPLVEIFSNNDGTKILAKLEFFNPGGSVKDRIGLWMINDAEDRGVIKKGTTIIEPTSGNTGIGLALVGAARGYKVILTMPDSMSIERRNLLKAYGAEVVLTPAVNGMKGAIDKATELSKEIKDSWIPQQFNNESNSEAHRQTTALEIWRDTEGKVDVFISGVGTGGTITGNAEVLKQKNNALKVIAVEPVDSAVLSGEKSGPHKIQGIGAGFIPEVLNISIYNDIAKVTIDESVKASRKLTLNNGIFAGISSGAVLHVAYKEAEKDVNKGKVIVVVLPDTGERYMSTCLFE